MSDLDSIVKVTVFTQSNAIAEPNFGLPMLVGYHEQFPERVRLYSGDILNAMTEDGFASGSQLFLLAATLLGQEPKVPELLIGRRSNAPDQMVVLTFTDTTAGLTYKITVGPGGGEAEYLVQPGDAEADIAAGLKADIDALGLVGLTTTVNGSALECTAADGQLFTFKSYNKELHVEDQTADPGLSDDLNAIFTANDDGYCILGDWQSKAQILAATANIQARTKLMIADVADSEAKDSTVTDDVLSQLSDLGYSRTGSLYNEAVGGYGAAGWAGSMLTRSPGSATWMFRQLAGVAVDSLTGAEQAAITSKHGNYYTRRAGVAMTQEGWAASGKFLDETRFLDWFKSRVQINVFGQFVNSPKVPYTEAGIAKIQSACQLAVTEGIAAGGIDGERTVNPVTVPSINSINTNDKNNRILKGIKINFFLAGAIHRTEIEVTALP